MKKVKVAYWTTTLLVSALFTMNVVMYVTRNPQIVQGINFLGYPEYLLDILAVAKIIGLIVLLVPKLPRLKEWAYAGFTIDMVGAYWSHAAKGDYSSGVFIGAVLALLLTSYFLLRKLQDNKELVSLQRDNRSFHLLSAKQA
ncbi:DoxX family protein [Chitinophagaceae bacterium LB-8]|uniref:DoxX family protein n=1 Tax=Paraflavisolibacter caeni TaxID=2982496 RepID=A0A9X2XPU3_9BACT|nr:DoxX family protein [Paraflavisolibacter caeni]MCU7551819.1 DoxX family protein [Paraflavisolibacter caeni]